MQTMDKHNKSNLLFSDLLRNTKQRCYKDALRDLKIWVSAFELQSYSDLADSLVIASEKLQNKCDDFDIYETDAYDN